jgi:hypothetical protein
MHIFLTNSNRERERSNPSSPSKLPSKRKNKILQEGCTNLSQAFTKKYHQETFAQERDTKIPKRAQISSNMSSHNGRDIIQMKLSRSLFIQNFLKHVCPQKLG